MLRWISDVIMDQKNSVTDPTDEGSAQDSSSGTASDSNTSVAAERDQLAAEKAELHELFLRRQAEFENYRRRVDREKSEFVQYASTEAVAAMLPVVDDFERALKQETSDREYQRGMELIYQRLLEALKKLGLEPITTVGQPFDPYVHQAIERMASSNSISRS